MRIIKAPLGGALIAFALLTSVSAQQIPDSAMAPNGSYRPTQPTSIISPNNGSPCVVGNSNCPAPPVSDSNGNTGSYNNPEKVIQQYPVVVTYTLAAGQTGMMVSSPFTQVLAAGYATAACVPLSQPTGWTSGSWTYEESNDQSSGGVYYAVVGNPIGGGFQQYTNDAAFTARAVPIYGRWFGINVTASSGTSGNLVIECVFSNATMPSLTVTSIPQAYYGSSRTTSSTNAVAYALNLTGDRALETHDMPTLDPLGGIPVQVSTSLEACHVAANHTGSAGPANMYEVGVTNEGSSAEYLVVTNAAVCPSSGATLTGRVRPVAAGAAVAIAPPGPPTYYNAGVTAVLSTSPTTYTPAAYGNFEMRAY